jgi:hypothetical protein
MNFIQGTANGATQPSGLPALSTATKTWPKITCINPGGRSWTQNGDDGGLTVGCNSNRDWSISHYIQNHGLSWHTCNTTVANGEADPAIKANFNNINATGLFSHQIDSGFSCHS